MLMFIALYSFNFVFFLCSNILKLEGRKICLNIEPEIYSNDYLRLWEIYIIMQCLTLLRQVTLKFILTDINSDLRSPGRLCNILGKRICH